MKLKNLAPYLIMATVLAGAGLVAAGVSRGGAYEEALNALEDLEITSGGVYTPGGGAGGFTIGLGAEAWVGLPGGPTDAGSAAFANSGTWHLTFDGGTDEQATISFTLPEGYDDTVDLDVVMDLAASGTSQATTWDLAAGVLTGADLDTTAYATILGTDQSINATTSGTQGVSTQHAWALSNAELGSPSAGDQITFRLNRDSGDASAVDAQVMGLWVSQ